MENIVEQLAIRDRFRQKMAARKAPEQRMREMAQLQRAGWNMLCQSPDGYAHFLRRNFRKRAVQA